MGFYDDFWETFQEGLAGRNRGLPIGFPRLERILNGIHRGRYYTLFSEGGTGKSSFVWSTFVINTLDHMIAHNKKVDEDTSMKEPAKKINRISVKILLYSLEVVKRDVIAKMICFKIYKDYKIIISPDYIYNRIEGYKVSKPIAYLIRSYKNYFDKLEADGNLVIVDSPRSSADIARDIDLFAKANGTFSKDKNGEDRYKPNNPNEFVIPIFDTVGNIKVMPINGKSSTKSTIDDHSANCRYRYRDLLNYSPINISHANRGMSDMNRAKMGEVFPKMSDIKETGMLEQDSSVVLTIFNPMNHIAAVSALNKFMGYDILRLGERFRCIGVLKNRHGAVNKRVGLLYIGENAHFEELNLVRNMTTLDYQRILDLRGAMHIKTIEVMKQINKYNPEIYKKISANLLKNSA